MGATRRRVLMLGGSVALALVIVWIVQSSNPTGEQESLTFTDQANPHPAEVVFPVQVVVARIGNLVQRTRANGILRARRQVDLIARTAGEVSSVAAYNGKYVRQREVLVRLDDREHRLAYDKARANLLAAQIEYHSYSSAPFMEADTTSTAQRIAEENETLRRAEEAYRSGAITEEAYRRAIRSHETSIAYLSVDRGDVIANKSGLAHARETYERAKLNLEWTSIRAPFAGWVADCDLTVGAHLSSGAVVLSLIDLSSFLVDIDVLETEAAAVAAGQEATISVVALPGEDFSGRVKWVNPLVDAKSKTMKVTVEIVDGTSQRASRLKPGMYATVRIATRVLPDRLLVPRSALLVRDQRNLVFRTENGQAKWCYVEVGEQNEQYIEIRSGIAAGDTIIVEGHYTLAHDARIRVTDMEER